MGTPPSPPGTAGALLGTLRQESSDWSQRLQQLQAPGQQQKGRGLIAAERPPYDAQQAAQRLLEDSAREYGPDLHPKAGASLQGAAAPAKQRLVGYGTMLPHDLQALLPEAAEQDAGQEAKLGAGASPRNVDGRRVQVSWCNLSRYPSMVK